MAKKRKKTKAKRRRRLPETPDTVHVFQYELTDEPIEERSYRKLPSSVKKQIERLHKDAQRKPEKAIPELLALKKQYPKVPQIYNFLTVAYSHADDLEMAEATIQENIHKNPDYLFARLNYAEICLAKKEYEKIPEIFDHNYDLKLLYPKRKRFHISEFANFMGLIGMYFFETDQRELAEQYNETLQEIAPSFPMAKRLNRALNPGFLTRLLRRLADEEAT